MEQIISREWFTSRRIFYRVLREFLPCVSIHPHKMFLRSCIEWCTKSVCPKLGLSLCTVRKKATFATLTICLECLKVTSLKTPSATESVLKDFSLLYWKLCTVLSFARRFSLPLRGALTVKPSVESGVCKMFAVYNAFRIQSCQRIVSDGDSSLCFLHGRTYFVTGYSTQRG